MMMMSIQHISLIRISIISILLVVSCLNHSPGDNSNGNTLEQAVKAAAGIYMNPSQHRDQYNSSDVFNSLSKTVLVTAFNHAYLNHLHNFKCFADRLDLKFFVIAVDINAHNAALNISASSSNIVSYFMNATELHGVTKGIEDAAYFREDNFNVISVMKLECVLAIMQLGYNVVFIDSDVAIVRDPIPYMIYEGLDYVYSINVFCPQCYSWDFYKSPFEGNTGVYYIRSTKATMHFYQQVLTQAPKQPDLDDQTIFWQLLRRKPSSEVITSTKCYTHIRSDSLSALNGPNTIVTCPLDGCMFSMGGLRDDKNGHLKDSLRKNNQSLILIHANFVNGNYLKMNAMKKHGFWITNYPDNSKESCRSFSPTI